MIRLYMRAAAFAVALFAMYVTANPIDVHAQSFGVHDAEIHELQRRADVDDSVLQRLQAEESVTADAVSELQGEERVFFGVISFLTGGSFVGQVVFQVSNNRRKQQ